MPESFTENRSPLAPEDVVKVLVRTFIEHPETKMEGKVKKLQYTVWRAFKYAMDEEEKNRRKPTS